MVSDKYEYPEVRWGVRISHAVPWIRHGMISFQCDEDQKKVRNEQNACLLIKQREDGKTLKNKCSLTRALSKPPFFDAQFIYFVH